MNFAHTFCHTYKIHGYGLLSYNVLVLCVWNSGILDKSCLKTKDPLNEWNVILIYYVMGFFESQKLQLFLKPFNAILENSLKKFFCHIFYMFYSIMIWNWKWKKTLLSISSKYSYLKLVFNFTRKGFWKETLIRQICDTLLWFCPKEEFSQPISKKRGWSTNVGGKWRKPK